MTDSAMSVAEEEPVSRRCSMYHPSEFIRGKLVFLRAHRSLAVKCIQLHCMQANIWQNSVKREVCSLAHSGAESGMYVQ